MHRGFYGVVLNDEADTVWTAEGEFHGVCGHARRSGQQFAVDNVGRCVVARYAPYQNKESASN
jgi:hypothetical protein